ncbi:uncharacterized protein LOC114525550 isoform X2 [Dendronephthya gigantea]|uniref:uncharacterized protein LOC114525550 isoform X2 n=1 Tax=Dendronephthya gigantea TaxID=151771 RepID=UPI00106CD9FF|nr:uncharacterized protein LOC114525550 isoform X2 [Dendronephthya gigantea]
MEHLEVNGAHLDSHRRESGGSSPFKSVAKFLVHSGKHSEPIYAALGKDLDETIYPSISDRTLIRNRALLHYIATLAVSNSETDEFNYEFVQSLLDGGANINEAVDTYGQTIFHEVARSWNLDVAAFLLHNGADINQQDKYGRSPLHVSAAADHADMVEFLLQKGANIDSRSSGDGQTPLHFAAKNDAVLSLKALLGFGANIDSLDERGRPPLQVAAELSRAATARILIDEGASSCIYDANGSSAMTVLTEKLPSLAVEALDQLRVSDTITRRELFYLNLLEESLLKKETRCARTPLETAVIARQFDVLMHPVMQRLVAIKWDQYGKVWTILELAMNLVYAILFTVFAVRTPAVGKDLYLPLSDKAWRIVLGLILILINIYQMYLQIKTTVKSQKRQKSWMKWRVQQLKDDLQYCHPRWQEEKYVKEEMGLIKGLPLLSTIDAWFIFEWFIIVAILVTIGLNLGFFIDGSSSVKIAYIRALTLLVILTWIRIMKYLRPFPGIGTLVLILGATGRDFVNWGFFYLLLFIPFTSCFWIIFGGNVVNQVPSYASTQRLIYTGIQMSVGEDFDVQGLVAADPVMARLLGAVYVAVMVIVCLNILIAYLSNTFTSVYSKAVENTSMQRAINVLTVEKFLTKNRKERYFRYVRENASPEVVSSSSLVITSDVRQSAKSAEQMQKDFKTSHEVLTQRFSRKVGKGKISTFDVLLGDVEKLKDLQNSTVNDLIKIRSHLEQLGKNMFGTRSPVQNVFQVKLTAAKTRQRKLSQRIRIDEPDNLSPRTPQAQSFHGKERVNSESRESNDGDGDESGENKKKTSLGDLIPRISIFKGRDKSVKKEKGSVKFADNGDDDVSDDETAENIHRESSMTSPPSTSYYGPRSGSSSPEPPRHDQKHSPRSRPRSSKARSRTPSPEPPKHDQQHSARSRRRSSKERSRTPSPGHDSNRPKRKQGWQSSELVPYNNDQGLDNDAFDEDYYETGSDRWERISADSISL